MAKEQEFISFGSPFVDAIFGGYPLGKITNLIGDSQTGKSFLACEAVYQALKKYGKSCKVRFNDAESGLTFNTESMYGFDMSKYKCTVKQVEQLHGDIGNFVSGLKPTEKGFYLVDSFDGLTSIEELDRMDKRMVAAKKDEAYTEGTYGGGKPKTSNEMFRTISDLLEDSNVALFIISQTREALNAGPFSQKWRINGGAGLTFSSSTRLFIIHREDFMPEGRKVGQCVEIWGMKVRSKFQNRRLYINILNDHGVDNISTVIDYLFELKNDYGKLDDKKCKQIDYVKGSEEYTPANIKKFCDDNGLMDAIKELGRYTENRAFEVLERDPEVMAKFVNLFGIMNREQFIQYAIEHDLEAELTQKAIDKFMEVEARIMPKRPAKTLDL